MSFLFWLFFIGIFICIYNKKNRSAKKPSSSAKSLSYDTNTRSGNRMERAGSSSGAPRTSNAKPGSRSSFAPETAAQKKGYQSTTEQLRKKAEADEREHEREKREAEYQKRKQYNGKRYAKRYILGDPVPKGMHVKNCGYCGAEL